MSAPTHATNPRSHAAMAFEYSVEELVTAWTRGELREAADQVSPLDGECAILSAAALRADA